MAINLVEPGDMEVFYGVLRHKQEGVYNSSLAIAVCPDDDRLLSVIGHKLFEKPPSAFVHLFLERDEVAELIEALKKAHADMADPGDN